MKYKTIACLSKKVFELSVFLGIALFGLGLLFYSKLTSQSAYSGIVMCINSVFPSLFPFFVLSNLIISTGMVQRAAALLAPLGRILFGISGSGMTAFILGIIGGYPVGARTAVGLYQSGLCSKEEAQRLLCFCNNSGPAFILGVVGIGVFAGGKWGVVLYICHIAASIIVGILFKILFGNVYGNKLNRQGVTGENPGFISAFLQSVTGGFSAILNVCAFVIFFGVAIELLKYTGVIYHISKLLSSVFFFLDMPEGFFQGLVTGGFEVTNGLYSLNSLGLGKVQTITLAAFVLGWGGLSVHFQTLNFVCSSGLKTGGYFLAKLFHGFISAGLVQMYLISFPEKISVFAPFSNVPQPTGFSNFFLVSAIMCLIIFAFFAFFSCIFNKNRV